MWNRAVKKFESDSNKKRKISQSYFNLISKYNKYFYCYFPSMNTKSAWYRFYFFIKNNYKNYKKLFFKIIKNLNKKNLKCFTGSCPEIYLEKSFKSLKNYKNIRLKNCKILGETSIALDVNHTFSYSKHRKNLKKLKVVLDEIFKP